MEKNVNLMNTIIFSHYLIESLYLNNNPTRNQFFFEKNQPRHSQKAKIGNKISPIKKKLFKEREMP